jgi:hypothetical protein
MYFNFAADFPAKRAAQVTFKVIYYDKTAGSTWAFKYDVGSSNLATALSVTNSGDATWKTVSVTVTNAVLQNNGPNGSDFALVNTDGVDDIFHMIEATYADIQYTLTANGETGGSISPASTNVIFGSSAGFVVTASNYSRIATLTTNGTAVTGMLFDNNSTTTNFIWSNVQASGVLAATFAAQVTTNAPAQVPYSWLAGYGLTNYNTDATNDVDLDGLSAWQEYIAGTIPNSATSVLKAVQNNRNVVTWTPQSNRIYSVYWSTNLLKGFTNLNNNILYPTNNFTNATPDPRVNHYQIKVRMQ